MQQPWLPIKKCATNDFKNSIFQTHNIRIKFVRIKQRISPLLIYGNDRKSSRIAF